MFSPSAVWCVSKIDLENLVNSDNQEFIGNDEWISDLTSDEAEMLCDFIYLFAYVG